MSATTKTRKRRLRQTKVQLLDELEALERRAAADGAEHRRAGAEPAAKEAQLRAALDNAPGGMMLADRDLNYLFFNSRYSEIYEFPDGLVTAGGSLHDELRFQAERGDFGPGGKNALIEQVLATYRKGEAASYEREIAGSGRTLQIYLAPTPEGGTVTIVTDISERKQAEAALTAQNTLLDAVFENMEQGVIMYDRELNVTAFNEQARRHLRFPQEVLFTGASFNDIDRYARNRGDPGTGDSEARTEERWQEVRKGKTHSLEYRHGDGAVIEIRRNAVPGGGFVVTQSDITERKRAENELKKSRERMQALADNLPQFITLKDREGRFLFVNKTFEAWICQTREDVIGKTTRDVYASVAEAAITALERQAIDDRQVMTQEVELSHPDGNTRTVIRTKFPVVSSHGEVLGVGTVLHDITERKQAEEALRESERRLIEILDLSPIAVSIVGAGNERLYGNSRLAAMFGLERDAMVGGDRVSAFAREDTARLYQLYEKDGAVHDFDIEGRRADGSSFWATRTVAPIEFDGRPATIHWAYDITERKRAEEELAEKEGQLRVALDNMPGGMVLGDKDRKLVFVNRQYSELHDFPDGLLKVGSSRLDEMRFQAKRGDYGPGDVDEVVKNVRAEFYDGESASYERTLASGRTLHFDVTPTPDGGYVTIATDITERKRAEEELAEKEAQLRVALDNMPGGMVLADQDGKFIFANAQYSELHDYPDGLLKIGGTVLDTVRFQAERGDYGPGDIDALVKQVSAPYEEGKTVNYERTLTTQRTLHFNVAPTPGGGYVTIATDITERKRAEEELAAKEAHLRVALDNMPGGISLADRDGNFVLLNARYSELHDYPDGLIKAGDNIRQEARFQAERGDFGPGDVDELVEDVFGDYTGGEPLNFQRTFANGRTLQLSMAPTPDGGYVNIATDITEIKQAQKDLSDQLMFVEALVDTIPNPIFVKDTEAKYKILNQAWIDAFGVVREEVIGKTVLDLEILPLEQRAPLQKQAEELLAKGGMHHRETSRLLADDKRHDMLYWETAIELSEGDIGGLVGVFVDITEQKDLERELAKSQEQFHALADNLQVALSSMSDGIFIIDGELNYVAFNQRYVDLLGFPEGLVREGGTIAEVTEFAAKRGDYGSQFQGTIDEIVSGRLKQLASDSEYVIENVTPTGRIVEYRGSPIEGGGYVSIMHDVTERRKAEEALEEAHETIKVQRDRMEDELNVGREIQMSMVPQVFPPFPDHDEFSIFAALEPAREVGGDFYDFFFVDEDRLCLCIGDVSGKGVPSALFMAVTKTLIKSRAIDDASTAGILTHVNAELADDNKASMFVTIFLAILNFKTGELVYTNAGHNPPYLRRQDGTLQRLDARHGPVVGALLGLAYRQDSAVLGAGDMLFMYTDGVTEERNAAGELYSEQRLAALLASTKAASVESAVQAALAAVHDYRGAGNQEDDVTVLAVQFQGSSMADPNTLFHATARNDLSEIAVVIGKFQVFAGQRGLPVDLARRISVIFDDLLNNVISYAFPDGEGHEIEIKTEIAANRLTVTISDDGIPFNPLSAGAPDTSLPLEQRAIGGLGIHLVRNLVDEVNYQRRIGRNVLTLVMRIGTNGTS